MRHIIYYSASAVTSGRALSDGDLMKAGRMDIAIHTIIQGLFLSHGFRKDTIMHLVFAGMPDPTKHITIQVSNELEISKKDIGNMIKKILYKYREGQKTEVFPQCFVEKKHLVKVLEELQEQGSEIFILDKKGESIRTAEIKDNCAFLLGDHDGLPDKELKRLKKTVKTISVGPKMYFASQTVAVVNNELDIRGI